MLKTKRQFITVTSIFIFIELILSILIQLTSKPLNSIFSLTSIVLAFLYVFISFKNTRHNILMLIALSSTVIADFFLCGLVEFKSAQLIAMCFFIIVQSCYFLEIYFSSTSKREKLVHLIIRASFSVILIVISIIVLKSNSNALSIISVLYFTNLIINSIYAFINVKLSILFPIGLTLFMLCDIVVGLNVMAESYIYISESSLIMKIINPGFNLAWLFYVPAQTLLAISTNTKKVR